MWEALGSLFDDNVLMPQLTPFGMDAHQRRCLCYKPLVFQCFDHGKILQFSISVPPFHLS